MIRILGMPRPGTHACLSLPALLARACVFVLILAFTLVLTWWGYDAQSCLMLLSGVSVAALRVGQSLLRPLPGSRHRASLRTI